MCLIVIFTKPVIFRISSLWIGSLSSGNGKLILMAVGHIYCTKVSLSREFILSLLLFIRPVKGCKFSKATSYRCRQIAYIFLSFNLLFAWAKLNREILGTILGCRGLWAQPLTKDVYYSKNIKRFICYGLLFYVFSKRNSMHFM